MLQPGLIKEPLKQFILELNQQEQSDLNSTIESFAEKLESVVFSAIKKLTITIPSGMIQVQGSPSAQSNIAPILLNNVIS